MPATSGTAGTARRARSSRSCNPALWDAIGAQPEGDAQARRRAAADRGGRGPGVPRQPEPRARGVRRLPRRAAVQAERRRLPPGRPGRLLLRRVRLAREPADLLRRPGHPRRRPLQGGERLPAAVRRASACSTARATSCRPSTARAGSAPTTTTRTSTTCRSSRCAARTAPSCAIEIPFPGRNVFVNVWQARVGHVRLYLLDTDLPENSERDRGITHRLYGGDRTTRLEQEIVLGVGGVRALAALGIQPTAWHINEGHAAFMILERVRAMVAEGCDAGRGARSGRGEHGVHHAHAGAGGPRPVHRQHGAAVLEELLPRARRRRARRRARRGRRHGGDFNMTALAIRGSRYHNGVSRIHGDVSARMLKDFWPQVAPEENPVGYVTNGVHVATFLAPEWARGARALPRRRLDAPPRYPGIWEKIRDIPDHIFWSVRQDVKARMFHMVRHRLAQQHARNHGSESHLERLLRFANPREPERPDHRLRPALRHLQARDAALQQPRQPAPHPRRQGAPGAVPVRRQGASGRRARPGADPHAGAHGAPGGVRRQDPLHRGLRPAHRAAPGVRRGRVAEQPGISARGLGHLGHEGRHERRDQPVDPRRLVGRRLRRRERLGDQARLARPSTRTGATRKKRARCTRSCRTR